MADQKGQQEPSMEEILASIRKIISEDDEAEKDNPEAPAAPPGESAPSAPRADDDVLELTEMVDPPSAPNPAAAPVPPMPAKPAPETAKAEEAKPSVAEPEDADQSASSDDDDRDASVESVMAAVRRMGGESDANEAVEVEADAAIDLVDGGTTDQGDGPEPFAVEPVSVVEEEDDGREIITDRAASAASQALSELAGALGDNRPRPDSGAALPLGGSNRTVEDLVREMLRPMLREWLDANLPELVQRLVRKEIKEMVRRAEDR